jgi:DNA modification methylase
MIVDQTITDQFALYNGDAVEVASQLPDHSVHLAVYSPPFPKEAGGCLYAYSSSPKDFSNCRDYKEFFKQYEFLVEQTKRIMVPGRIAAVHCMDIPNDGANAGAGCTDYPGDIIRLHESFGFQYIGRHAIWKEPLGVRNRTMAKGLTHQTVIEDSSLCDMASADYLLLLRAPGKNPIPITHEHGLMNYAGFREMPANLLKYRGWTGKQTENKYSQWIWRQYASAFWDDVRLERVLKYKEARDQADERHMHPLQLDVIERIVILRSNPGEVVLSNFAGVGSELYGAIINGRKAIGSELKKSYYAQAVKNLADAHTEASRMEQQDMFAGLDDDDRSDLEKHDVDEPDEMNDNVGGEAVYSGDSGDAEY